MSHKNLHLLKQSAFFHICVYLFLIWIHVLKHVFFCFLLFFFENPSDAEKHLKSHLSIKNLLSRPSSEAYIDGLCDSLKSICIRSPVKGPTTKRRLSDMLLDKSKSSSEQERTKNIKQSRVAWDSDTADDALSGIQQCLLMKL